MSNPIDERLKEIHGKDIFEESRDRRAAANRGHIARMEFIENYFREIADKQLPPTSDWDKRRFQGTTITLEDPILGRVGVRYRLVSRWRPDGSLDRKDWVYLRTLLRATPDAVNAFYQTITNPPKAEPEKKTRRKQVDKVEEPVAE